jgi:CheY-like chemotaxis protein
MSNNNSEHKTILVAEDDDANYKFLEIIISLAGYKVIRAENGAVAVDICRNNDISLVFMDIRMPEMDGLEATRQIRQFNTIIPVIAQSAFSLTEEDQNAISAGCTGFIMKPINRKTVVAILNEYLKSN